MELYWILRLPELNTFFSFFGAIGLLLGVIGSVVFLVTYNDVLSDRFNVISEEKKQKKLNLLSAWHINCNYIAGISLIFMLLSCFIPDTKQLALMLGWDAIRSDSVKEVVEILKEKIK